MSVVSRVLLATLLMLIVAAIVYAMTSGHVFFFPFLLVLGVPIAALFRRPPPGPPSLN